MALILRWAALHGAALAAESAKAPAAASSRGYATATVLPPRRKA